MASHLIFELDAVDLQEDHGRMYNVRSSVVRDDSVDDGYRGHGPDISGPIIPSPCESDFALAQTSQPRN